MKNKIKHRGFIILAMTFIFSFAALQNAVSQMPYGWRCLKCGSSTMSLNKPLQGACIKGGGHKWEKQAPSGSSPVRWVCGKCGNLTMSVNKPLLGACIKGGGHNWQQ